MYIVCNGTCTPVFPARVRSSDLSGLVQSQTLWWQAELLSCCWREDGKDEHKEQHSREDTQHSSSLISVGYRSRYLQALSELLGRRLRLPELTPTISISKGFLNKYQNRHFSLSVFWVLFFFPSRDQKE